jgi:ABC-type uncharacterized transport system YnjBCD permease subunit
MEAKVTMALEEEALIVEVVMLVAVEAEFRLKRVLIKWHLLSQNKISMARRAITSIVMTHPSLETTSLNVSRSNAQLRLNLLFNVKCTRLNSRKSSHPRR